MVNLHVKTKSLEEKEEEENKKEEEKVGIEWCSQIVPK